MTKKQILLPFLAVLFSAARLFSQGVAINENAAPANASAILDVSSGSKGVLIPRMTATERTALGSQSPAEGLLVYDSDSSAFFYYNAGWVRLAGGGMFSNGNAVILTDPLVLGEGAVVFNDFRVPATTAKTGGSGVPSFSQVSALGNIHQYHFGDVAVAGNEQSLYFNIQMPHTWKEGSSIYPHVHWMPSTTGSGTVRWGLEYTWVSIDGTFGPSNTIYGEEAISGNQHKHIMTAINSASMDPSGKEASSMILCRIFRNSSNALDTYAGDAILLEFDLHYQIDRLGDPVAP